MKKKYRIGYTMGVFDLFHIGHLNIIKKAKSLCDYLIVGVTTDERALMLKGSLPIIPFDERVKIIESIKYVDQVVPKNSPDIKEDWDNLKFNVLIKGSDWKGRPEGNTLKTELKKLGVKVKYFPYTEDTSSTMLKDAISKLSKKIL
ncbi:Glycerol-3-phosphate cytidylyltransferase [Mariniphaga anaerophila]|uniref:Glycerol-3-phosphate cytidylyltransferase n=1 Tax=Mariniphaga anaerophila TaxID=1484053 RepID=A0A1M5BMF4_9BACT|nr:adenylyltransferase/cytidyltransferase family protein [Mariniphaga anaerophila]SHF43392.1 Glycerol-3-phosphate cytidylyltransferase [Mariniphaga anaerophila]